MTAATDAVFLVVLADPVLFAARIAFDFLRRNDLSALHQAYCSSRRFKIQELVFVVLPWCAEYLSVGHPDVVRVMLFSHRRRPLDLRLFRRMILRLRAATFRRFVVRRRGLLRPGFDNSRLKAFFASILASRESLSTVSMMSIASSHCLLAA